MQPDWENFAKAILSDWPTNDVDGSVLFDLSLQYGMITEVPGGYNSDHHIDADGIGPEEGDPWYEYTFRGEAGPGLYSVSGMTKRIEELEAKLAKAVEALEGWVNVYTHCTIEEGVCCCGDDMNNHTLPMDSNHMPLDHGAYIAGKLAKQTETTLAELKGEK